MNLYHYRISSLRDTSPAMRSARDEASWWEDVFLPRGMQYPQARRFLYSSCSPPSEFGSDQPHDVHSCDMRLCPVTCDLCRRLCTQPHLHGLVTGSFHLCGSVFVQIEGRFNSKLGLTVKHTHVLHYAQHQAYAKSTQPLYLLRLPLQESMRRFSTPR